jgi:hypothetical protein
MSAFETITQFSKMLKNLDGWIETASAHAQKKNFEADVFANSRLAPDQYSLTKQVQSSCDAAKFTAAYLTGQKAPSHPDTETTIAELRARIATCLAYLETFKAADFAGAADRRVAPAWMKGKWVKGDEYLTQAAIPNFYFHVTTAYSILRHNGVDLGKMNFLGSVPMRDE